MPEKPTAPRGRAVGDEDAATRPMDDAKTVRGDESCEPDIAAVEADRAKSSGRPPLAGGGSASGRGPAGAPRRDRKAE